MGDVKKSWAIKYKFTIGGILFGAMFPVIATIIEIFNNGYDFSLEINHRVVSVNPAFTEMFGHRQEDIVGVELDPLVATLRFSKCRISSRIVSGKKM